MLQQDNPRTMRTGWQPRETERLFDLAQEAQRVGRPLKSVFDAVAAETGRRPNSVRNYYYARARESTPAGESRPRAFEPFTEAETEALIREVLSARAKGESVRGCTLRMAAGSDKAMLRYQNKYRSMVRNDPAAVRRIYEEMVSAGSPAADPYSVPPGAHVGRPRKEQAAVSEEARNRAYGERICADRRYLRILRDLDRVEGLNVAAFMEALGALALSALRGAEAAAVGESTT